MTASVADKILARVLTVVQGVPGIANADRNRNPAIGRDELPYANIVRGTTDTARESDDVLRTVMDVEVHLYAAGANYEQTLDALHVAVDTALHADAVLAVPSRTLLCTGTSLDQEDAEYTCGRLTARYQIQLFTAPGDFATALI